ncbi:MAG: lipopolysaccharide biosynthesis protein [Oscillospiraceae bacterium]
MKAMKKTPAEKRGVPVMAKDTALNTTGTFVYFALQWLSTIVVRYTLGFEEVAVYQLAISFCNIFGFISRFGVRNYQISDVEHRYTDGDYYAVRLASSVLAVVLFCAVLPFMGFSAHARLCCVMVLLFKLLESVTDVLFGSFQKARRYDAIAISYSAKGVVPLVAFALCLYWVHDLMWGVVAMSAAYLLVVVCYDIPVIRRSETLVLKANAGTVKPILLACVPLMVYTLVNPYINFVTRYAVEQNFSARENGYYASIALIAVITTTFCGPIWSVLVPRTSKLYNEGRAADVRRLVARVSAVLAAACALILLACKVLGAFALGLVFGQEIVPYSYLLAPMVLASVLMALASYYSSTLVALRGRGRMLAANVVGAVVCTAVVVPMVRFLGMVGACWALCVGIGVQVLLLGVLLHLQLRAAARPTG